MRFLLLLLIPSALAVRNFFPPSIFSCARSGPGLHKNPVNDCSNIYIACVGKDHHKLHCDRGLVFDDRSKLCKPLGQVADCQPKRPQQQPQLPQPPPFRPKPQPRPQNQPLPFPKQRPILPRPQPQQQPFQPQPFQPQPLPFPNKFPRQPLRDNRKRFPVVNFNCAGKQDGDYGKGCSNVYYSCSGGRAFERECANRALKFDTKSKQCDLKQYVSDCGGRPRRPTPPPKRFPRVKDNGQCKGKKDGVYPDPRNACSKHYLTCGGNFGRYAKCPGHFKFDVKSGQCMSSIYIQACGGTPTTKRPIIRKPIQRDPSLNCAGKRDGDYAHPRHRCSYQYYSCHGGIAEPRECGTKNLVFDGKKCELKAFVPQCGGRPRPVTKAPVIRSIKKIDFNCKGKADGLHSSLRNACSGTFYACNKGFAAEMKCYSGLVFDIDRKRCIERQYAKACGGRPTPPTIEKKKLKADVAFDCEKYGEGAHSKGCSHQWVQCEYGRAILMSCPTKDLKFDKTTKQCDYKKYVRECGGRPRPPKKIRNDHKPRPRVSFNCQGKRDGFYPDPRLRCAPHYYTCSSEFADKINCPKGTFYDHDIKGCNFKELIIACGGSKTNPKVEQPRFVQPKPVPFPKQRFQNPLPFPKQEFIPQQQPQPVPFPKQQQFQPQPQPLPFPKQPFIPQQQPQQFQPNQPLPFPKQPVLPQQQFQPQQPFPKQPIVPQQQFQPQQPLPFPKQPVVPQQQFQPQQPLPFPKQSFNNPVRTLQRPLPFPQQQPIRPKLFPQQQPARIGKQFPGY